MIYVDSSAFVKLVLFEAETIPFREFLARHESRQLVSSALLTVETRRSVRRGGEGSLIYTDAQLRTVRQIDIDADIVDSASRLPGDALRSLDAIHLATALLLRQQLDAFVTYDKRLAVAAEQQGLRVAAPE